MEPIQLIIDFSQFDLEPERLDRLTQALWKEFQNQEGIQVDRIPDPNLPEGGKAIGGFLIGLLMAEVSKENLKKLLAYLSDRLINKPIKLKVKAPNGRELELEASSQQEFEFAYQKAQEFLNSSQSTSSQ